MRLVRPRRCRQRRSETRARGARAAADAGRAGADGAAGARSRRRVRPFPCADAGRAGADGAAGAGRAAACRSILLTPAVPVPLTPAVPVPLTPAVPVPLTPAVPVPIVPAVPVPIVPAVPCRWCRRLPVPPLVPAVPVVGVPPYSNAPMSGVLVRWTGGNSTDAADAPGCTRSRSGRPRQRRTVGITAAGLAIVMHWPSADTVRRRVASASPCRSRSSIRDQMEIERRRVV